MSVTEQGLQRSESGRFTKTEEIDEQTWNAVEQNYPDIIELYSGIPLSLLIWRKRDSDYVLPRRSTNPINLVRQRFGLGLLRLNLSDIAKSLGLSPSGVHSLTEATLGCIAEDTGMLIPYAPGRTVNAEMARIKKITEGYQRLKTVLQSPEGLTSLEQAVIEQYLEGNAGTVIAGQLNEAMSLTPAITAKRVFGILWKFLGRYDYVHPSRLTQRSLKAREILAASANETYVTEKARITEEILEILSTGGKRDEIIDELGIGPDQYRALINEVFLEFETDHQAKFELEEIYMDILRERPRIKRTSPYVRNRVARNLLDPYRAYRARLGGGLTSRESAILENVAVGVKEIDIAKQFTTRQPNITEVIDWLLGETGFRPWTWHLHERQELFDKLSRDVASPSSLPVYLLTIDGMGTIEFMERLAGGKTFQETVDEIAVVTGKKINRSRLLSRFKAISAYYNY